MKNFFGIAALAVAALAAGIGLENKFNLVDKTKNQFKSDKKNENKDENSGPEFTEVDE